MQATRSREIQKEWWRICSSVFCKPEVPGGWPIYCSEFLQDYDCIFTLYFQSGTLKTSWQNNFQDNLQLIAFAHEICKVLLKMWDHTFQKLFCHMQCRFTWRMQNCSSEISLLNVSCTLYFGSCAALYCKVHLSECWAPVCHTVLVFIARSKTYSMLCYHLLGFVPF